MITPSFSITATERVLPKLALDFTTASLDSRVTVTRSLNTATRINSSGYIETVNANLPRFDFSPTSVGTCRGLLIEETRANLCLQSSDFTSGSWTKTDTTPTTAAGTAPDGTNTATLLTQGTAGTAEVWQSFVVGAGNTVTYSRYVKKGNAQWYMLFIRNGGSTSFAYAFFDLTNGVVGSTSSGGGFATLSGSTITDAGGGWYRVTFTVMIGASFGTAVFSSASVTANGTATPINDGTRYEWGCQAEVGAFATSYIPTTTTSLTRNADVVSMQGTNFSDWYNASEGTICAVADTLSTTGHVFSIDNGANERIYQTAVVNSTVNSNIVAGGSNTFSQALGSVVSGTTFKTSLAYKANNANSAVNAVAGTTDTTVTIPTVIYLRIGTNVGGVYLNGHIASLRYFPLRLTNVELQAFSK